MKDILENCLENDPIEGSSKKNIKTRSHQTSQFWNFISYFMFDFFRLKMCVSDDKILPKSTVSTEFRAYRPGNCVFPQNIHNSKLGEIMVFYAVEKPVHTNRTEKTSVFFRCRKCLGLNI